MAYYFILARTIYYYFLLGVYYSLATIIIHLLLLLLHHHHHRRRIISHIIIIILRPATNTFLREHVISRQQTKIRRNMTKKSMLGRNTANMETSECIYPPKLDDLEKEESGRVGDLKVSLPPNVIGTQLTGKVKRFGVKLRYNGCPLRIGSAYCTPEDASKVASVFRDCIQVDSKGNLFFA